MSIASIEKLGKIVPDVTEEALLFLPLLLPLQSLLGLLGVLPEILVLELVVERVGDVDHLVDVHVFPDVLHVLQHHCELVVQDHLLAGHDDRHCEEVYELQAVRRREETLPDAEGVEEGEVLREQQGDPPEAVEEWVYLQLLQAAPNQRLNHLNRIANTTSISLT